VELEILDERGRELYLERKRWPDLLRFHYEGVIDVYSVVPNLKKQKDIGKVIPLYLAIPKADMDRNPELTQTAGYENL
ncbi:MAG: RagB/SusD family nutrient uptake outer membrane protein, partial [Bacteroidales bacterium]|nr:RagB/SusD family nutrient uptake outer membrane protein [Bacteroidales bacterium]